MFRWQGESRFIVPPVLEASTLTHAQRRGLFARRSPLLRFQDDENLVALTRKGHQHAFDSLVERYQSRLLGFCRQMLGSTEDAEDVLQEVFVAAYNAMVADERPISVRPWLYRIARNRCLNHLRKPTADGQDTMDTHPHMNGVTTHEHVQNREEFRNLLTDVGHLPETQRSALLLREIDAMSYEEIAQAMDTTVPGVKSLLVRARIALAESSQARQLTCDEVRLELAEAAEGIAKVTGPARRHIKACDPCHEFRAQLRSDTKALAAIFPAGPLLILKGALLAKLSGLFGGGGGGAAAGAGGGGGRRGRCGRRSRCAGRRAGAARRPVPEPPEQEPQARVPQRPAARPRSAVQQQPAVQPPAAEPPPRAVQRPRSGRRLPLGSPRRRSSPAAQPRSRPSPTTTSGHEAGSRPRHRPRCTRLPQPLRQRPTRPRQVRRRSAPPRRLRAPPPPPAAHHGHGPAPDRRPDRAPALGDRRHHGHRYRQAQAPQERRGEQRLSAQAPGCRPARSRPASSPSTCDADGDGVADPGAPSSCTSTTAAPVSTGVEQGAVAPAPYSAPKQHKAAPEVSAEEEHKAAAKQGQAARAGRSAR